MKHAYKIDLLPDTIKMDRKQRTSFKRSIFYGLTTIIVFIVANIVLWIWQYTYELDQITASKQIEKAEQEIAKLRDTETEIAVLKKKYDAYEQITSQRTMPQTVIADFSALVPKVVSITNFSLNLAEEPNISVSGQAPTRRDVVIFTEALNRSEKFSGSEFNASTQAAGDDNEEYIGFNLTTNLKSK